MDIDVLWYGFSRYRPMLDELYAKWVAGPPPDMPGGSWAYHPDFGWGYFPEGGKPVSDETKT